MQRKRDIPLENIMKEVELTTQEGSKYITLVTEDIFLYGSKDKTFKPNKEKVLKLVKSVASHPRVKAIQPAHISLAPVVHSPDMVKEVAEILIDHNSYAREKKPIVTAETGLETGSIRLIRKYMAGKMLPFKPEQWKGIVTQAFSILNDNSWCPLATLIVGLPEENEKDVIETLELMDDLRDLNVFYVPLLFVPLESCSLMNKQGAEVSSLTKARWELLTRCWEYNARIWGDSFIEEEFRSPLLCKFIRRIAIPFAAEVAGIYYRMKHSREMKDAIWRIANA